MDTSRLMRHTSLSTGGLYLLWYPRTANKWPVLWNLQSGNPIISAPNCKPLGVPIFNSSIRLLARARRLYNILQTLGTNIVLGQVCYASSISDNPLVSKFSLSIFVNRIWLQLFWFCFTTFCRWGSRLIIGLFGTGRRHPTRRISHNKGHPLCMPLEYLNKIFWKHASLALTH